MDISFCPILYLWKDLLTIVNMMFSGVFFINLINSNYDKIFQKENSNYVKKCF